jgi:hypothetical protein
MSSAISSVSNEVWEPIFPNLPLRDIRSCYLVNRSLNVAVNHYFQETGIHSQDQLIERVQEFMKRKLSDPKENKWAASWTCHFPFNPYYQCRIIVSNHEDQCAQLIPSKEELDYAIAVTKGSRPLDPNKKENWPLPYDEETCIFSKKLPKRPLPPCNDYVKFTPYAQTYSLLFDKTVHPVAKYLTVAITFPTEMEGFTRRTPYSETLRSDFIYTLRSIMQTHTSNNPTNPMTKPCP